MEEKHLFVNIAGDGAMFGSVSEALDSIACDTADKKMFPAPVSKLDPVVVHIGKGVYREKIVVTRPNVTFVGSGCEDTVLVYGEGAFEKLADGEKRGTFRTASVRISASDFTAKHLTIQNDAGFGHTVGQALALYVDGDRCYFEDCHLIGSQDTLFTAPLPMKEAVIGGFRGPGEFEPRIPGRQLYRNCLIQGDVDFIFGSAIAYFDQCTLYSKLPGDRIQPESPTDETIYGYVTAASTPQEQEFGYVFRDCRLVSDCPAHSVYLGRPWREWAKTVFLHCELGEHIHPAGWQDWEKPHDHFYFGEYKSYGPGADFSQRADFSHQLTDKEAAVYSFENVLQSWVVN